MAQLMRTSSTPAMALLLSGNEHAMVFVDTEYHHHHHNSNRGCGLRRTSSNGATTVSSLCNDFNSTDRHNSNNNTQTDQNPSETVDHHPSYNSCHSQRRVTVSSMSSVSSPGRSAATAASAARMRKVQSEGDLFKYASSTAISGTENLAPSMAASSLLSGSACVTPSPSPAGRTINSAGSGTWPPKPWRHTLRSVTAGVPTLSSSWSCSAMISSIESSVEPSVPAFNMTSTGIEGQYAASPMLNMNSIIDITQGGKEDEQLASPSAATAGVCMSMSTLEFPLARPCMGHGRGVSMANLYREDVDDVGAGVNGNGAGPGGGRRRLTGGGGRGDDGGGGNLSGADPTEVHYQNLLQQNPGHPLFLRNYALYLAEVKHDYSRAEEYLERAILANPGDGELLCLYAQMILDIHHDRDRAANYFEQAIQAAPEDSYVAAAYASFLWTEEEDEHFESNVSSFSMAATRPNFLISAGSA